MTFAFTPETLAERLTLENMPPLMTKQEAGQVLRINWRTVDNFRKLGKIEAVQVGIKWMYRREHILGYIERNTCGLSTGKSADYTKSSGSSRASGSVDQPVQAAARLLRKRLQSKSSPVISLPQMSSQRNDALPTF